MPSCEFADGGMTMGYITGLVEGMRVGVLLIDRLCPLHRELTATVAVMLLPLHLSMRMQASAPAPTPAPASPGEKPS